MRLGRITWDHIMAACLILSLLALLVGCACPPTTYRAVPVWMVPEKPVVPTIVSDEMNCLTDEVYLKLAERDRTCWQYARELRALLGPAK